MVTTRSIMKICMEINKAMKKIMLLGSGELGKVVFDFFDVDMTIFKFPLHIGCCIDIDQQSSNSNQRQEDST